MFDDHDQGDSKSSTYMLVYPDKKKAERRGETRKIPNGALPDYAKIRESPRKKPPTEIHGRVLAFFDSTCEVMDISRKGLRIRTKVNLPKGEEIGLHLLVPAKKDQIKQTPIIPACEVVWSQSENDDFKPPYYMGLRILQMTKKQEELWFAFVDALPDINQGTNKA